MGATPVPADIRDRIRRMLDEGPSDPTAWVARLDRLGGGDVPVCSEAVRLLFNQSLEERDARTVLLGVLERRAEWATRLGRDPGFAVAALDHGSADRDLLRSPVVLERDDLDRVEAEATHDPSTGLLRPRPFAAMLRRETARASRRRAEFALVLFQIDGFRAGVDRFGLRVGDAVLRETAEIVVDASRATDRAGRLDGGRFGIVLPGTGRSGAYRVAERVRAEVRGVLADRVTDERPCGQTVSGGIAVHPSDADTAEKLLILAERGLESARAHGGDAISLFHDERRAHVRYPARAASRVALTDENGVSPAGARALDVSEGGACIDVDHEFPVGCRLHVYLKSGPNATEPTPGWSTFARVVRALDATGGRRRLGVAFERPMPADEIRRHAGWDGSRATAELRP